jgi:uncharacterized RDD family membrane protein YckC
MLPITKASVWKRIFAFLLDFILLTIVATGGALLVSAITGYTEKTEELQAYYTEYEEKFDVEFSITKAEYDSMSEQERAKYDMAYKALTDDQKVIRLFNLIITLTILVTSFGILIAVILTEYVIPLILKNGQTVGKKVFGLCVCTPDAVKVSSLSLFIRTILGKFTLEIMIPVLVIIMIYFNTIGILGIIILALIVIVEAVIFFSRGRGQMLHDLMANTMVVDMASTRIFDTNDEMIEYVKEKAAEQAAKEIY